MVRMRAASVCLLLVPLALAQMPNINPVIQIDIFRAMQVSKRFEFTLEDDDLADIGGVTKYVMSECLAESDVGHDPGPGGSIGPWPKSRKYDIDGVVRSRFKVHTAMDVIRTLGQRADFGPFVTFDNGISTNTAYIKISEDYGEYVGLQQQPIEGRVNTGRNFPIYWYSTIGLCPNKAWGQKGTRANPVQDCLRYSWKSAQSAQIPDCVGCPALRPCQPHCYDQMIGGLCWGGKGNESDPAIPEVEPTGLAGCAYSYGAPDYVLWDDVVGLTNEDCGGRKCKDFYDFRHHCTNDDYKKRFDPTCPPPFDDCKIISTDVCVEYDMHPTCRLGQGCISDACKKLLANSSTAPVEVGHPFWKGRCDPKANHRRSEEVMAAFKLEGAGETHVLVDQSLLKEHYKPCYRPEEEKILQRSLCKPNPDKGGPYCYRGFSGVCQPCFVPGTMAIDPLAAHNPDCPFGATSMPEYLNVSYGPFKPPNCKSTKVKDLCCLYTGTCEGSDDPEKAALTDDGLTLVAARQNTADMKRYLTRLVTDAFDGKRRPKDGDVFDKFAYYAWSAIPELQSISDMKTALKDCKDCTELGPAPTPTPAPGPGGGDGGGPPMGIIIVIVVLVVVLGIGAVVFFMRKKGRDLRASDMGASLAQAPAAP